MNVPGWALALMIAVWLLWGALCWIQGYRAAQRRWMPVPNMLGMMQSPRTKSDE